ncbi:MAG TPA: hypothetical protein VN281_12770, partial [Verrucomicrobiae bacterium]|nr:hypothetical protein [Verrucomicrobiae bacterium]
PPTGDTNTSFIMDDDGRGKTNYVNYGFTNGAQYFYYVSARDVLGRDGFLSPGLLATVCDRMPPLPPFGVHVINDYSFDVVTLTSNQALRVIWKQNPNTNDTVTNYWVYRWTNLVEMNALQGDPSNNLIGIVAQIPGVTNNSFLDNGAGSPSSLNEYGKTFWYTVRAGDAGACGQNLSGAGGPAFGVLRQRNGPGPGSGTIQINCLQPFVNVIGTFPKPISTGPDTNNYDVFLNCTRLDSRFEWAEFYGVIQYGNAAGGKPLVVSNFLGRVYYLGGPAVSVSWRPVRTNTQVSVTMQVACRAALSNGKISTFAVTSPSPPSPPFFDDVEFQAIAQSIPTIAGQGGCTQHDPGGGGGGVSGTNNIVINFLPSPGSTEYRLYRRVDSGPLSLLCQGPITNILQILTCYEAAPPVNGGTICFYLQLLDVNGNPSPMTPLGCVDTLPSAALPVPVLAKISPVGDTNSPGMTLSWFCAPYGVERFEARIAGLPTLPNTNNYQFSSLLAANGAMNSMMVTNGGTNLTLPFCTYLTPRVGPGFGNNGAQFTVPCNIEIGKTYFVTVRALGKDSYPGDFSNLENFLWTPTNTPGPNVPWPALGPPGTNSSFNAMAFFLSPTNANPMLASGTNTGNAVWIGYAQLSPRIEILLKSGPAQLTTSFDPNSAIFTNPAGDSIFPCAMYRYQVPNANFPVTSGDVIQVSPLMENIAYQLNSIPGQGSNTFIWD